LDEKSSSTPPATKYHAVFAKRDIITQTQKVHHPTVTCPEYDIRGEKRRTKKKVKRKKKMLLYLVEYLSLYNRISASGYATGPLVVVDVHRLGIVKRRFVIVAGKEWSINIDVLHTSETVHLLKRQTKVFRFCHDVWA